MRPTPSQLHRLASLPLSIPSSMQPQPRRRTGRDWARGGSRLSGRRRRRRCVHGGGGGSARRCSHGGGSSMCCSCGGRGGGRGGVRVEHVDVVAPGIRVGPAPGPPPARRACGEGGGSGAGVMVRRGSSMARRAPFPQSGTPASIEAFNKAKCARRGRAGAGVGPERGGCSNQDLGCRT